MDIWEQMLELEPFLRHIGIEAEALEAPSHASFL